MAAGPPTCRAGSPLLAGARRLPKGCAAARLVSHRIASQNAASQPPRSDRYVRMTATFVIDEDSVVGGACVEPDFTIRQEPSDIFATVRQLAGSQAEDATHPMPPQARV